MARKRAPQIPAGQQASFNEQRRFNAENLASCTQMMRFQEGGAGGETTKSRFDARHRDAGKRARQR
jgi:hypothetical protein